MNFIGQHILSVSQFDREGILSLFETAKYMEKSLEKGGNGLLNGKILATLFFEPSTRTRFSFEAAMLRLGGRVISNPYMQEASSIKKGESLEDTGKVVSQIADVIVCRHPVPGSVERLSEKSDVPVINAGDGTAEHPTQALLDLYTIWKNKGTLDGLTIGMIGDLKYGRVPHSQCNLLRFFDVDYIFVSPKALQMPSEIKENIVETIHDVIQTEDFASVIHKMDVIACTRIQKERFENEEEYKKYEGVYILTSQLLDKAKRDAIVIHPLPRVDEISTQVDSDPRAKYFEQIRNGVAVRMALLTRVLGVKV